MVKGAAEFTGLGGIGDGTTRVQRAGGEFDGLGARGVVTYDGTIVFGGWFTVPCESFRWPEGQGRAGRRWLTATST